MVSWYYNTMDHHAQDLVLAYKAWTISIFLVQPNSSLLLPSKFEQQINRTGLFCTIVSKAPSTCHERVRYQRKSIAKYMSSKVHLRFESRKFIAHSMSSKAHLRFESRKYTTHFISGKVLLRFESRK